MNHKLYRMTTLGHTLQESLDELSLSQTKPELAEKVLLQFDKEISDALSTRVKNRISFKGKLSSYRFCDNVWTLIMNDVEFREVHEMANVGKVKFVACDGSIFRCETKTTKDNG